MPSQLHEALLLLFRNRPTLAPELIRDALHFELPAFTEARIDSADLTEVKPAEYHADLVVLLLDRSRSLQLASLGLDEERGRMYVDLVLDSLSDAARRELITMDPAKYEYQSDFAKRYIGMGRAEGRAAILQRLLAHRFGPLPADAIERLSTATIDELDAIGERLLGAQSLHEALGPR